MAASSEAGVRAAPAEAPRSPLRSLVFKAVLLALVVGLLPVTVANYLFTKVAVDAVEQSERQRQTSAIAEVSRRVFALVPDARGDVEAIAVALAFAASSTATEEDALKGVNALLATRKAINAFRFEVPSRKVDVVLSQQGVDRASVPRSTAEARAQADERDVAFFVSGPGQGVIVVPVPPSSSKAPPGYVTARVDLTALSGELEKIAAQRFPDEVSLLIVDGARRAVASFHVPEAALGVDVGGLPIWKNLSDRITATQRVAVINDDLDDRGVPSIGAIESVEGLGWSVAVWRPRALAYATLATMGRNGFWINVAALLLAVVVGLFAAVAVTRPILKMVAEARLIGERRWRELDLGGARRDELGELSRSLGRMAADLEQSEIVIGEEARQRADLSRFLSRELVDAIVRGDHPMALGGKRTAITVVFADVVAFTKLAEARPAEQVVAILNDLFSMLSEIVFRHQGTVDKFIGDCIMGVWGAPVAHAEHAALALAAAEDMMRFLETANETWKVKYDVEIRIGIGVNSGEAIVGNVGSNKRMEYTVIGDVVNVAARLEAIAAPNQILVGEATQALAGEEFALTLLGARKLTGREKETQVYTLAPEEGVAE